MSVRSKIIPCAAAIFLVACGGAAPDFTMHGAGVVVRSSAAFARQPGFPQRVESTVDAALAYWGGSWDRLAGTTLTFDGSRSVQCNGTPNAVGCFDGDIRVSTVDAGESFDCVEQTALVHEVGHAVIGDPGHTDPRWLDFGAVARVLGGREGYRGDAEVPCTIFVSVWQHPPDQQITDRGHAGAP